MEDFDLTPDRSREIEVSGRKFTVTASDPYGHWSISQEGRLPDFLAGTYTSLSEAEKRINAYVGSVVKPTRTPEQAADALRMKTAQKELKKEV